MDIVSIAALLKQAPPAGPLPQAVIHALSQLIGDPKELPAAADAGRRADDALAGLVSQELPVHLVLEVMGHWHDTVTRRILGLCQGELARQGHPPPVAYCWINFGSAARREQSLRTDQDNAIVYADPLPRSREAVSAYFDRLAETVVTALASAGFEKCTGQVMATNPRWRRSLGQWLFALDKWVGSAEPEDVRALTILLDFRPLWGDRILAEKLRAKAFAAFGQYSGSGHLLVRDDREHGIPLGFRGRILTEKSGPYKNQLNLKTGGLVHLVNGARILAVNNAVAEPSTLGRFAALERKEKIETADADLFKKSFLILMELKIRENLRRKAKGESADNHIFPDRLDREGQLRLREALMGAVRLQKLVAERYSPFWLNFIQ